MPAILSSTIQCGVSPIRPTLPEPCLEEYMSDEIQDVTVTPGAHYTRYINVDGLEEINFAITFAVSPEYAWETPYLGVCIWVDGASLSPFTYRLSKNHPTLRVADHVLRKPGDDNVNYISPLKFGKLEIVDDDTALSQHISEEELKQLGVILIQFYRGTDSKSKPATPAAKAKATKSFGSRGTRAAPSGSPSISVPSLTKIPERKLKGQDIAYGVQFGPARAVVLPPLRPSANSRGWVLLDTEAKPFLTCRFLYRSGRALRSLGVLPREEAPRREFKPVMEMSPHIRIESPSSSSTLKKEKDDKTPGQSSQSVPRAKKPKIEFVDLTELD